MSLIHAITSFHYAAGAAQIELVSCPVNMKLVLCNRGEFQSTKVKQVNVYVTK